MKKGFTLLELLAALVFIALLIAIVAPNVTDMLDARKQTLLNTQIKEIEEAARAWGAKNIYMLPTGNDLNVVKRYDEVKDGSNEQYGVLIINLRHLKQSSLIDKDVKNPVTNALFSDDLEIYITNEANKISYEVKNIED